MIQATELGGASLSTCLSACLCCRPLVDFALIGWFMSVYAICSWKKFQRFPFDKFHALNFCPCDLYPFFSIFFPIFLLLIFFKLSVSFISTFSQCPPIMQSSPKTINCRNRQSFLLHRCHHTATACISLTLLSPSTTY